jgi:hypothetical protein
MDPEDDELLLDQQAPEDGDDDLDPVDAEGEEDDDISFGDEDDGEEGDEASLPKKLRGQIRDRDRAIAALSRRAADAEERARPAPVEVGPRPTLEECEYDEEEHNRRIDEWVERRVQAETSRTEPANGEDEARQDVAKYEASITKLRYADATDVVAEVRAALTPQQEFIVASVTSDPGLVLYALGKNPAKLRELVDIRNPAKFIARVALTEANMRVGKKQAPDPERVHTGNAMPKGADKEEARLEKEADRTGDRTALIRYRKRQRDKA